MPQVYWRSEFHYKLFQMGYEMGLLGASGILKKFKGNLPWLGVMCQTKKILVGGPQYPPLEPTML